MKAKTLKQLLSAGLAVALSVAIVLPGTAGAAFAASVSDNDAEEVTAPTNEEPEDPDEDTLQTDEDDTLETEVAQNISGNVNLSSITAGADVTLAGNTTINVDTDKTIGTIREVNSGTNLTITGNGTLTISGRIGISGNYTQQGTNVIIQNTEQNDAILTMNTGKVIVNGGSLRISSTQSSAIIGEGGVEIANAQVDITCVGNSIAGGSIKISGDSTRISAVSNFATVNEFSVAVYAYSGGIDIESPLVIATPNGGSIKTFNSTVAIADANGNKALSVLINNPSGSSSSSVDRAAAERNVGSMYTGLLGRGADAAGLKSWTDELASGKVCMAQVIKGFVDSAEFKSRNLSNKDYVKALYEGALGRTPSDSEMEGWVKALENGTSRDAILNSFFNSDEFRNNCAALGVEPGIIGDKGEVLYNKGVYDFVKRNYEKALGRSGESAGVNDWSKALLKKEASYEQVVRGFLNSAEFTSKDLSDEDYVEVLYVVCLGRPSDPEGKAAWVKVLKDKTATRDQIIGGFTDSPEFNGILAGFGL